MDLGKVIRFRASDPSNGCRVYSVDLSAELWSAAFGDSWGGQVIEALVPVRELAAAAVGAYLGLEMLSHLQADRVTPGALFDAAMSAAVMIDALRRK